MTAPAAEFTQAQRAWMGGPPAHGAMPKHKLAEDTNPVKEKGEPCWGWTLVPERDAAARNDVDPAHIFGIISSMPDLCPFTLASPAAAADKQWALLMRHHFLAEIKTALQGGAGKADRACRDPRADERRVYQCATYSFEDKDEDGDTKEGKWRYEGRRNAPIKAAIIKYTKKVFNRIVKQAGYTEDRTGPYQLSMHWGLRDGVTYDHWWVEVLKGERGLPRNALREAVTLETIPSWKRILVYGPRERDEEAIGFGLVTMRVKKIKQEHVDRLTHLLQPRNLNYGTLRHGEGMSLLQKAP